MKRLGSVFLLALAIVVAGFWVSGVWQASAGSPPPAAPPDSTAIPPPLSIPGTPIATPFGFAVPPTPLNYLGGIKRVPPAILPSVTPLPISRITDFAPNLSNRCKSEVIVRRSNGAYETFLVPIGEDRSRVKATLGPGDQIFLDGPPPVLMGPGSRPTFTADGRIEYGPDPVSQCK